MQAPYGYLIALIDNFYQTEDYEPVNPSDLSFGFRQCWPKTGSIHKEDGRQQPGCHKPANFHEQKQCFLYAFHGLHTLLGVSTNRRLKTENRKLITEDRRLQTFKTIELLNVITALLALLSSSSEKGLKNLGLNGDSSPDHCDAGVVLHQLNYQAN